VVKKGRLVRTIVDSGGKAPGKAAITKNRYQGIDFEDLWRRLYAYAVTLVRGAGVVIDCGVSAEDLVQETLQAFAESPNGLGWRESKGELRVFLGVVLRNKFVDHIRREKKVARPDPDATQPCAARQSGVALDDGLALQELRDRLLILIKGRVDERELEEFILAASMTTSEGKVNQQLADLMQVDVSEVINRRRRLLRVAGVKELYEEFRNERKRNQSAG
jgi:DNA-directed RNA polymerase specialized sigma24 family protein